MRRTECPPEPAFFLRVGPLSVARRQISILGSLSDTGVDEFVGVVFESSPQTRARTRALLRQLDA